MKVPACQDHRACSSSVWKANSPVFTACSVNLFGAEQQNCILQKADNENTGEHTGNVDTKLCSTDGACEGDGIGQIRLQRKFFCMYSHLCVESIKNNRKRSNSKKKNNWFGLLTEVKWHFTFEQSGLKWLTVRACWLAERCAVKMLPWFGDDSSNDPIDTMMAVTEIAESCMMLYVECLLVYVYTRYRSGFARQWLHYRVSQSNLCFDNVFGRHVPTAECE